MWSILLCTSSVPTVFSSQCLNPAMGIYTVSGGENAHCEQFLVGLAGGFCPFRGLYFTCKEKGRRGSSGTVRLDGVPSHRLLFGMFLFGHLYNIEFFMEMGFIENQRR